MIDESVGGWLAGWMNERKKEMIDECMGEWLSGWINRWIDVWMFDV